MLNKKAQLSSLLLLILIAFSACIQTEAPDRTKRFALRFNGDVLGARQIISDDTLVINRLTIHMNEFEASTVDGQVIQSTRPLYIDYSDANLGFTVTIAQEDLGFLEIDGFDSFQFSVDTVSIFQNDQNPLLVEELRFFSIYVDMVYNNEEFEFRTQLAREVNFDFAPVDYTTNNETMNFVISVQPYTWFVDTDADTLIDPTNILNGRQIDTNIFSNVDIEVEAGTIFE